MSGNTSTRVIFRYSRPSLQEIEEAATVFRDPKALTIFDPNHSEIEDRWITMGISKKGRLLIVCHTFQEESKDSVAIRIFSSRKAIKKESRLYGG